MEARVQKISHRWSDLPTLG